ncbi:MAG: hypothetical protein ABGX22_14010 [Pirellulaceae bacterium]
MEEVTSLSKHWLALILVGCYQRTVSVSDNADDTNAETRVDDEVSLPSPYYLDDDVQYFAPGSEFQLPRAAAGIRTYTSHLPDDNRRNDPLDLIDDLD